MTTANQEGAAPSEDAGSPLGPLVDAAPVEDFDAFWQRYLPELRGAQPAQTRIRGVLVTAPLDVPVAVELRMHRANTYAEQRYLLGLMLGGESVVDQLAAAGVGAEEQEFLLAWAYANAIGDRMSLAEVAENMVRRRDEIEAAAEVIAKAVDDQGKAPSAPPRAPAPKRKRNGRKRS